jgi:hypothetical protein
MMVRNVKGWLVVYVGSGAGRKDKGKEKQDNDR